MIPQTSHSFSYRVTTVILLILLEGKFLVKEETVEVPERRPQQNTDSKQTGSVEESGQVRGAGFWAQFCHSSTVTP